MLRFKEKPDLRTAVSYLNEGDYYWNSGMFVWSAQTIVEALRRYLPEVISQFESVGTTYLRLLYERFGVERCWFLGRTLWFADEG